MQPFRVNKDAQEKFFKHLYDQKAFRIGFDAFYFCFIAGITTRKKEKLSNDETDELVAYFPDKYSSRGKLLLGLFLKTELELLGVSIDERKQVHTSIASLVNPEGNFLSNDGVDEFNKYAHGGYEQLVEWFEEPPRSLETFLRSFKWKIDAVNNELAV